jgi:tRNA U34 5-methylaminomethyl-2-thiouridine-forming methyltransferase MnmC
MVLTRDGSHTVLHPSGDTYHSVHGAMQESQHVFLQNGLTYYRNSQSKTPINILEVGLGTALNALLTVQQYPDIKIHYTALEPYPLTAEVYEQLNYAGRDILLDLHRCAWSVPFALTPQFVFQKLSSTLAMSTLPKAYFDVVYFDAFAPNSQPELWTVEAFEKIFHAMTEHAVLVTYCAKGQVKRNLKAAGFTVESLAGPPGKREMVRALKPASPRQMV